MIGGWVVAIGVPTSKLEATLLDGVLLYTVGILLSVLAYILLAGYMVRSIVSGMNELRIQAALEKVMRGRTSIIIAHRLSTIEHCDRIVVMRKGRIVEQGSHRQLLDKGGYYARLHRLQYAQGDAAD